MAKRNPNKKFYNVWCIPFGRWTNLHPFPGSGLQDVNNPIPLSLERAQKFLSTIDHAIISEFEIREIK